MAQNRFQDISIRKTGSGSFYTAGKLGGQFKRRGMAGLLRATKAAGRHSYAKNLSAKDLEIFQTVVGKRLSRLSKHSEGFSLKTRRAIMGEFEKMRRAGLISASDKDDFRSIVSALGIKQRASMGENNITGKKPTERATNFVTDSKNPKKTLSPEAQRHIKANIAIDNVREADEQNIDLPGQRDVTAKRGGLAKNNKDKIDSTKKTDAQDIDLPEQEDVIAKRGNLTDNSKDKIIELDIG